MRYALILFLTLGFLGESWAQTGTALTTHDRIIRTDEGNFMVSEPLGWLLDLHPAGVEEAVAVLFPKGTSLQTAPSVIYISTFNKDDQGFKDLGTWVEKDEAEVRQAGPQVEVKLGPLLYTRLHKTAVTRFYLDEPKKQFEGAVYIEEKDLVIRLSLESGDGKIFNEDLPALQELVASYEWMWDRPDK